MDSTAIRSCTGRDVLPAALYRIEANGNVHLRRAMQSV